MKLSDIFSSILSTLSTYLNSSNLYRSLNVEYVIIIDGIFVSELVKNIQMPILIYRWKSGMYLNIFQNSKEPNSQRQKSMIHQQSETQINNQKNFIPQIQKTESQNNQQRQQRDEQSLNINKKIATQAKRQTVFTEKKQKQQQRPYQDLIVQSDQKCSKDDNQFDIYLENQSQFKVDCNYLTNLPCQISEQIFQKSCKQFMKINIIIQSLITQDGRIKTSQKKYGDFQIVKYLNKEWEQQNLNTLHNKTSQKNASNLFAIDEPGRMQDYFRQSKYLRQVIAKSKSTNVCVQKLIYYMKFLQQLELLNTYINIVIDDSSPSYQNSLNYLKQYQICIKNYNIKSQNNQRIFYRFYTQTKINLRVFQSWIQNYHKYHYSKSNQYYKKYYYCYRCCQNFTNFYIPENPDKKTDQNSFQRQYKYQERQNTFETLFQQFPCICQFCFDAKDHIGHQIILIDLSTFPGINWFNHRQFVCICGKDNILKCKNHQNSGRYNTFMCNKRKQQEVNKQYDSNMKNSHSQSSSQHLHMQQPVSSVSSFEKFFCQAFQHLFNYVLSRILPNVLQTDQKYSNQNFQVIFLHLQQIIQKYPCMAAIICKILAEKKHKIPILCIKLMKIEKQDLCFLFKQAENDQLDKEQQQYHRYLYAQQIENYSVVHLLLNHFSFVFDKLLQKLVQNNIQFGSKVVNAIVEMCENQYNVWISPRLSFILCTYSKNVRILLENKCYAFLSWTHTINFIAQQWHQHKQTKYFANFCEMVQAKYKSSPNFKFTHIVDWCRMVNDSEIWRNESMRAFLLRIILKQIRNDGYEKSNKHNSKDKEDIYISQKNKRQCKFHLKKQQIKWKITTIKQNFNSRQSFYFDRDEKCNIQKYSYAFMKLFANIIQQFISQDNNGFDCFSNKQIFQQKIQQFLKKMNNHKSQICQINQNYKVQQNFNKIQFIHGITKMINIFKSVFVNNDCKCFQFQSFGQNSDQWVTKSRFILNMNYNLVPILSSTAYLKSTNILDIVKLYVTMIQLKTKVILFYKQHNRHCKISSQPIFNKKQNYIGNQSSIKKYVFIYYAISQLLLKINKENTLNQRVLAEYQFKKIAELFQQILSNHDKFLCYRLLNDIFTQKKHKCQQKQINTQTNLAVLFYSHQKTLFQQFLKIKDYFQNKIKLLKEIIRLWFHPNSYTRQKHQILNKQRQQQKLFKLCKKYLKDNQQYTQYQTKDAILLQFLFEYSMVTQHQNLSHVQIQQLDSYSRQQKLEANTTNSKFIQLKEMKDNQKKLKVCQICKIEQQDHNLVIVIKYIQDIVFSQFQFKVPKYNFQSCFHSFHQNCLSNANHNNLCPICVQDYNQITFIASAILPISFTNPRQVKKKLKKFHKQILSILFKHSVELQLLSISVMIFSHLVKAGIFHKLQQYKQQKMIQYLQNLLKWMYRNYSPQHRQQFQDDFNQLVLQVKKLPSPHLQIQINIVYLQFQRITMKKLSDKVNIYLAKQKMLPNQFRQICSKLKKMGGNIQEEEEIQINQTIQTINGIRTIIFEQSLIEYFPKNLKELQQYTNKHQNNLQAHQHTHTTQQLFQNIGRKIQIRDLYFHKDYNLQLRELDGYEIPEVQDWSNFILNQKLSQYELQLIKQYNKKNNLFKIESKRNRQRFNHNYSERSY